MIDQLRNPGYYWVRFQGQWVIASYGVYDGKWCWKLFDYFRTFEDSNFTDIIEKTIKP